MGQLVAVGEKRLSLEKFRYRWRKGLRSEVKEAAPPHGLCLIRVGYEEKSFQKRKVLTLFQVFLFQYLILQNIKEPKKLIN